MSPSHESLDRRKFPIAPVSVRRVSFRALLLTVLLLAALLLLAPPPGGGFAAAATVQRVDMVGAAGPQRAVLVSDGLYLEAQPLSGEGLLAFSRRLCGTDSASSTVAQANGGQRRLRVGAWYRIPFGLLTANYQREVVQALFPGDRAESGGWRHRVGAGEQTLWAIAERFTGRGESYRELRQVNGLADNTIYSGQNLLIPAELLRAPLRSLLPASSPSDVAPRTAEIGPTGPSISMSAAEPDVATRTGSTSAAGASTSATSPNRAYQGQRFPALGGDVRLEYGRDASGEYAIYRLKPGEALYSSVVVRFTGRVYANDVNALASEIARGSGVADVTDMPIGYPVKVPFDLLQPEFLPPGHPRRQEYEQSQRASAAFSNTARSRNLLGITVIIDPGHGGNDVGASRRGVWESVYVYDISMRLKRYLEATTAAQVFVTTEASTGHGIGERDVLPYDKTHRVLTDPIYSLKGESTVGVHLRWYLANRIYREAMARGAQSDHVVFLSIHADSLHPSIRGAMAYIPDAQLRRASYAKTGSVYTARREVRENPRVTFSREQRARSEGLSRELATEVIASFARNGLAVHPDKPVRQKIYRGRKPWVPAVLRYNLVPASMLFEVGNLGNDEDRKLLQSRAFREKAAMAIAEGVLRYYGVNETSPTGQQATAGK